MNQTTQNHYESLMEQAKGKAESKFNATFVTSLKNVLFLRKNSPRLTDQPYFTIKVNFYDMDFYDGHYDMNFDDAVDNLKERVCESHFNPVLDITDVKEMK